MRKVAEGIEAARAILPRCWFDAEACADRLKALRHYRVKESSGLPLHDENSHFADSFRYLAVGYREGMSRFGAYRKPWDQEIDYPNPNSLFEFFKILWCAIFWHNYARDGRFMECRRCGHREVGPLENSNFDLK